MRFTTILILMTVGLAANISAQDSTFQLSDPVHIPTARDQYFWGITCEDLDWNGTKEIIFSSHLPGRPRRHLIGIIENGEIIHQSEPREDDAGSWISVADFNNDGRREIATESFRWHSFDVYSPPDYGLTWTRDYCFQRDSKIYQSFNIRNQEGEYEQYFFNWSHVEFMGRRNGNYSVGRVYSGSPMLGNTTEIAQTCRLNSIAFHDQGEGRFDYFAVGRANYYYNEEIDDEIVEVMHTYWLMSTSYQCDFNRPDSTVLAARDVTFEEPDSTKYFHMWSPHSIVKDLDGDGDLEWIAPWFDEINPDTFYTHITCYNPEDFSVEHDLVIPMPGIERGMLPPIMCKGVKVVDINNDGIWEIVALLRGWPLLVIDSRDFSIIMESDINMEDDEYVIFEIGKFLEDGNELQLVVQSHLNELLIYDLPEDWTTHADYLTLSESTHDFDTVRVDSTVEWSFTIHNQSPGDVTISEFRMSDDAFSAELPEELTLEPDETYDITVTFEPPEAREYIGVLTMVADRYNLSADFYGVGESLNDAGDNGMSMKLTSHFIRSFPNPFNSETTISYSLLHPGYVSLQLFNLYGQRVSKLFEGNRQAGVYSANLSGRDLASGLYFMRLEASDQVLTRKVMLIR